MTEEEKTEHERIIVKRRELMDVCDTLIRQVIRIREIHHDSKTIPGDYTSNAHDRLMEAIFWLEQELRG